MRVRRKRAGLLHEPRHSGVRWQSTDREDGYFAEPMLLEAAEMVCVEVIPDGQEYASAVIGALGAQHPTRHRTIRYQAHLSPTTDASLPRRSLLPTGRTRPSSFWHHLARADPPAAHPTTL